MVLPAPFGPEQAEDAARLDGQRDVVERDLAVLVDLGEVLGLDDELAVRTAFTGGPSANPVRAGREGGDINRATGEVQRDSGTGSGRPVARGVWGGFRGVRDISRGRGRPIEVQTWPAAW